MEYVSQKTVNILERRLGLMHLFFLTIIAGYMLGVRLIVERGYTAVEISHGFVSARLEGKTYSMGGGQAYAVDVPELIASQLESDAMFVPTTITTTRSQKQDNCTDPQQPCNSDADCMRQPPVAYGLCEDGQCMQLGWCPRESPEVSQTTELQVARPLRPTIASRSLRAHRQLRVRASQNLRDLQVVLLGDIAFPRLGGPTFSTEDGRKVRTRWTLSDIVRRSGVPYATAVR